ncbi:MAG: lytic murein transglycosylase [Patescibacteria group bacterium]
MKQKFILFFITVLFLISTFFFAHQTNANFDCLKLTSSSNQVDKDYCKNELAKIEAELAKLLNLQKEQQKHTGTLKGDITYLASQINALKTKVKSRALVIAQLKVSIKEKETKIQSLSSKIEREYHSLAKLLRNTNEFDNENFVHLVLSDESVSNFYSDVESYASIKQAIKASADSIRGIKTETEAVKQDLEKKQDAETDAKSELENAQKKVSQSEVEKQKLLSISKDTEAAYQKLAADKKAKADKIRAALFPLAGVSKGIPFGTALVYAKEAQSKTGIDPAFLLAILTQESNLGANVGQCYLTNVETGAGAGKNTGTPFINTMKPTRDVQPFLMITKALGLDPFKTPVSCPIAGVVGYGGAMGPAQFIPSTWQIFIGRLQVALGHYPNPWEPEDAFMASSMYLTDLGGVGESAAAQSKAACKYYGSGGATCGYSTSVLNLKAKIQANIDLL